MQKRRVPLLLFCVTLMIPLSGCIGSGSTWCGAGHDEMYGGYDYVYSNKDVASDNSINVTIGLLKSGGGWLEESEDYQESQSVWVTLTVKMSDGSEQDIGYNSNSWEVNGDSSDGIYWSTYLYYQSPAGFCDDGCEELKFSAGYENGVIYYDETCDSSPWINLD